MLLLFTFLIFDFGENTESYISGNLNAASTEGPTSYETEGTFFEIRLWLLL